MKTNLSEVQSSGMKLPSNNGNDTYNHNSGFHIKDLYALCSSSFSAYGKEKEYGHNFDIDRDKLVVKGENSNLRCPPLTAISYKLHVFVGVTKSIFYSKPVTTSQLDV